VPKEQKALKNEGLGNTLVAFSPIEARCAEWLKELDKKTQQSALR
jgi:hypothetical protein